MYGWRAKIGLITPMCQSAEHAFHLYAPEGVSVASTKLNCSDSCWNTFALELERASACFKDKNIDLIALGYAFDGFAKDGEWNRECVSIMEQASGTRALTSSGAVLEACQALGAQKAAVLTPYPEERNQRVKLFWERCGLDVTNIAGMDMTQYESAGLAFEDADEYFLYQHAIRMDLKGADALFLDCMELTAMEIIDALETALEIPVITCQQAALWSALRHCHIGAKLSKLGNLFTL